MTPAHATKLDLLRAAKVGWDYPDSQPMHPQAEANYLAWLPRVANERIDDAEPTLTDEGW